MIVFMNQYLKKEKNNFSVNCHFAKFIFDIYLLYSLSNSLKLYDILLIIIRGRVGLVVVSLVKAHDFKSNLKTPSQNSLIID